jgi:hypothetical protein
VQTVIGEILQEATKIAKTLEGKDVTLRVNPEVAKILKSSKNDYLQEIEDTSDASGEVRPGVRNRVGLAKTGTVSHISPPVHKSI